MRIDAQYQPNARLGNSSQLQFGEWVVASDNALAPEDGPRLTTGDDARPGRVPTPIGPIRTDAAINPADSSGPRVKQCV